MSFSRSSVAAAIWLAAALLFQVAFAHAFTFRNAAPSTVLVVVVWYALRTGPSRAGAYGLIAGLCEDLLATGTGGAFTISTTIVAVLAGLLSRNFFADSLMLAASATALATLLRSAIFWGVMSLEGYPAGLGAVHAHQALWQALFNALLTLVAMLIARRVGQSRLA